MVKIGDLCIIRDARQASVNGKAIQMSSRAFDILQVLIDAQGALVSINTLINKVWPTTVVEENNVQVHICTLRRVLGKNRHLIKTVPGRGYQLATPTAQPPNSQKQNCVTTSPVPMAATHFFGETIGREREIQKILTLLLGTAQLITLVGPPGVGKSRVAYDAMTRARERFDFIYYADLSEQLISNTLLDDIKSTCHTAFTGKRSAGLHIKNHCKALVVLDNCDQVSEESLSALTTFITQHSGFVFIASCRKPLHSALESRLRILPLSFSTDLPTTSCEGETNTAVDMFVSRVSAQDSTTVIDNAFLTRAVALVSELDGLPLAIEIASNHTVTLGIEATAKLIADGVDLAARNRQTGRLRDRSLGASLASSWQALTHDQQMLAVKMTEIDSDLDLQGVINAGGTADLSLKVTLDSLSVLIDHALVDRQLIQGETVYRLLKTVRRFVRFSDPEAETFLGKTTTKSHRVVAVLESPCHRHPRPQVPIQAPSPFIKLGPTSATLSPTGFDMATARRLALICDS